MKTQNSRQKSLANLAEAKLPESRVRLIRSAIQNQLPQIFGYHALLYTPLAKSLCADELVIKSEYVLAEKGENIDLKCRFEEMPIASDSIDLAVLPCVLESSNFPHQILREVERILIPEGVLIIVGRNPYSWYGLKNRYQRWRLKDNSTRRDISRGRINDWLNLLSFETEEQLNISLTNERLQKSQNYLWVKKIAQHVCDWFCSYYIIIARKKVSTMTPIRPSWRKNKQLVPSRLMEPSVRAQVENWFEQIKSNSGHSN